MSFDSQYQKIMDSVKDDMFVLEEQIKSLFLSDSPLDKSLLEFLTAPSKRLRPLLGFLFLRGSIGEVNQKQRDALLAVELIHNATLIHDDIIDDAMQRRKSETLNAKFDENLAVIAGDFLLSIAMEKIIEANSVEVIKLCTSALKRTCQGEISQYFSKFKLPSLDDYIEKSKNKTALLFEVGVLSCLLLCEKNIDESLMQKAKEFSQNFGIAFQIRDDLMNVLTLNSLNSKDIDSGIYTAPVIFAAMENSDLLSSKNILESIKKTKAIEKTKDLMDNYFAKAKFALDSLEEGTYKMVLADLIDLLNETL